MIKDINYLTDEEFEEISQLFNKNFDEYMINYIIPDVVSFYLANRYVRNCLSVSSIKNHIYSAKDVFNIKCDIDELLPKIKAILRIKYNLKIVKDNPMTLESCNDN